MKPLEGVVVGADAVAVADADADAGLMFTDLALMRSRTSIPSLLDNASNLSIWLECVALSLHGFADWVLYLCLLSEIFLNGIKGLRSMLVLLFCNESECSLSVRLSCADDSSIIGTGPTSSQMLCDEYVSGDNEFDFDLDVREESDRDFIVRDVTRLFVFETVFVIVFSFPNGRRTSRRALKSKYPRPFSGVQLKEVCVFWEDSSPSPSSLLLVVPLRMIERETKDLCRAYNDGLSHPSDPLPAATRTELIFDRKPATISAGGGV